LKKLQFCNVIAVNNIEKSFLEIGIDIDETAEAKESLLLTVAA